MATIPKDVVRHLAEIALAVVDASAVEDICQALQSGRLEQASTGPIRSSIAHGNPQIEIQIASLQSLWSSRFSALPAEALASALRASASGILLERELSPKTQIVWSGPKVEGSFVRATREVVREIMRGSQHELLIVGYWLAAPDDGEGIIGELIDLAADAMRRGAVLTMILDERKRTDGRDNRGVLLGIWPSGVPLPRLLTWKLPTDDKHLKLHAKVLVADERDALVTSANLTGYAMDRNMEMGIRVVGRPAATISQHLKLLESQGTLQLF
jgi:cardiolipin synthase A/B